MKKVLLALCGLGVLFFAITPAVWGQESLESCFNYYDYGRVKVYISSDKSSYNLGDKTTFSGTINNLNKFPIRSAVLYAQIKRVNENVDFHRNGHFLVDRKRLLTNLNFLPGENKNVTFEYIIPAEYPNGDYQMQFFILSENGFNYSGRNFLEEDFAGVANFAITSKKQTLFYFDLNTLLINGENHSIREGLTKYPKAKINIVSNLAGEFKGVNEIPVKYYIYSFDDAVEENLRDQGETIISKKDNYQLNVDFVPKASGAYVFVAEINKEVRSMFKYRFLVGGDDPSILRVNDLGITNYPPAADDKAYICFHAPSDNRTANYKVLLTVIDGNKTVAEKAVSGKFDSSINAISVPLDKLENHGNFKIRGELTSDKFPKKTIEVAFACENFSGSFKDINLVYDKNSPNNLFIEGRDGCGEKGRVKDTFDQIRVIAKNGQMVKEDYNKNLGDGVYKLSGLPGGDYQVEVKKGDTVKVLSISIPPRNQSLFFIMLLLLIAGIFIGRKYLVNQNRFAKRKK